VRLPSDDVSFPAAGKAKQGGVEGATGRTKSRAATHLVLSQTLPCPTSWSAMTRASSREDQQHPYVSTEAALR
jgi:hypothetical protein